MKAIVLQSLNQPLKLAEWQTPRPDPDEVLVQVMACGIDATDWKILDGFAYVPKLPIILGHETAGIVAELGSQVTDFHPGDRVIAYNYYFCGQCAYCRAQREQLCVDMTGLVGILGRNGGYAEYMTVPARQLVSVPDNVTWPDAAVCCDAGITAVHAVGRGNVKRDETVLVIGVGGVGAVVTQLCKAAGATVIAVDQSEEKIQRACKMGADVALNSNETDVVQAVAQQTNGQGVDCVLDVVGLTETVSTGMDSLARGGRLVLIGYTDQRYPLKGEQLDQNELTIIGTRGGRLLDLIDTVDQVSQGTIKSIVTDLYPLKEASEALSYLRSGKALGRVVLLTPAGAQEANSQSSATVF